MKAALPYKFNLSTYLEDKMRKVKKVNNFGRGQGRRMNAIKKKVNESWSNRLRTDVLSILLSKLKVEKLSCEDTKSKS